MPIQICWKCLNRGADVGTDVLRKRTNYDHDIDRHEGDKAKRQKTTGDDECNNASTEVTSEVCDGSGKGYGKHLMTYAETDMIIAAHETILKVMFDKGVDRDYLI
ncbi:hypothetical protein Tco_0887094 [Tanacetum coccineum]